MSRTYLIRLETHKDKGRYYCKAQVLDALPTAPASTLSFTGTGHSEEVAIRRAVASISTYNYNDDTYTQLLNKLANHCGETGVSEGAVETLERILAGHTAREAAVQK